MQRTSSPIAPSRRPTGIISHPEISHRRSLCMSPLTRRGTATGGLPFGCRLAHLLGALDAGLWMTGCISRLAMRATAMASRGARRGNRCPCQAGRRPDSPNGSSTRRRGSCRRGRRGEGRGHLYRRTIPSTPMGPRRTPVCRQGRILASSWHECHTERADERTHPYGSMVRT